MNTTKKEEIRDINESNIRYTYVVNVFETYEDPNGEFKEILIDEIDTLTENINKVIKINSQANSNA
jgi:hypothetical protein